MPPPYQKLSEPFDLTAFNPPAHYSAKIYTVSSETLRPFRIPLETLPENQ